MHLQVHHLQGLQQGHNISCSPLHQTPSEGGAVSQAPLHRCPPCLPSAQQPSPDLPDHLQAVIFSYAAAPFSTCKTAASVRQDPAMLAGWLISDPSVASPLRKAAVSKLWDVCHVLVDSQHFDSSKHDHSYALYRAAAAGQAGLVEKLLEQGAWVEQLWSQEDIKLEGCKCYDGRRRFQPSSQCPHAPDLHTLLGLGHPLYPATQNNHSAVCSLLLKQGIHPETAHMCVCYAASSGHLAALQVLVQEGPTCASQLNFGMNPMFKAAGEGQKEVVELLLALRADVYNTPGTPCSGAADCTSCLLAAVEGGRLEMVQLLLQHGMSLERDWQQALEVAATSDDIRLVRLLIGSAHAATSEQPQQQPQQQPLSSGNSRARPLAASAGCQDGHSLGMPCRWLQGLVTWGWCCCCFTVAWTSHSRPCSQHWPVQHAEAT